MKSLELLLILLFALILPGRAEEVLIKPNDSVNMEVFEEAELNTKTRILKSGEAVFPLIGPVKIAGLTIEQATARIRDLYAADYLVSPRISLTVQEYAKEYVDVLGSVASPGRVLIPDNGRLDVAAALASAGGLTPIADYNRIQLDRADGTRSTFSESTIKSTGGPLLRPGDRLITYENPLNGRTITVSGQVRRPGPLRFPLDGKLELISAIALAGDLTDLGNRKRITVTRGNQVFEKNLENIDDKRFRLQPDDMVNVAERRF
jgi:polysaccharide export outer membrane protein